MPGAGVVHHIIRLDLHPLESLPVSIRKLTCRATSPRDERSASLARSHKRVEAKGPGQPKPVKARPALPVAPKARALTGLRWSGSGLPLMAGTVPILGTSSQA